MASDKIRMVEEVFDAVNAGDADAVIAHLDPDVDWRPTAFLTGEAEFKGHTGVREWMSQLHELAASGTHIATFAIELEELDDGRVLVLGDGKLSREEGPIKQKLGWIWEFGEDGRITAMSNYLDPEQARRVADDSASPGD